MGGQAHNPSKNGHWAIAVAIATGPVQIQPLDSLFSFQGIFLSLAHREHFGVTPAPLPGTAITHLSADLSTPGTPSPESSGPRMLVGCPGVLSEVLQEEEEEQK